MKKQLKGIFFLGLFLILLPDFGSAEIRYVSDRLKVTVRSGPGTEYKILDVAESGDRVEILKTGEDWTLVKLDHGLEGFITSRYLISEPTHEIKLEQLQVKCNALSEVAETLREENILLQVENKNLKAALENAENSLSKLRKPQPPVPAGSATGFFVTATGYAITNHHVVENCKRLTLRFKGEEQEARLIAEDEASDLALIKVSGVKYAFVKFRGQRRSELGESIMIAGYPLKGLL